MSDSGHETKKRQSRRRREATMTSTERCPICREGNMVYSDTQITIGCDSCRFALTDILWDALKPHLITPELREALERLAAAVTAEDQATADEEKAFRRCSNVAKMAAKGAAEAAHMRSDDAARAVVEAWRGRK